MILYMIITTIIEIVDEGHIGRKVAGDCSLKGF